MRKALILLALLASPAYAESRGDFKPPEKPRDWYMEPRGGSFFKDVLGVIILSVGDRNEYQSSTVPPLYEQARLERERRSHGQIYAKPDPVICQWEPGPNAIICKR